MTTVAEALDAIKARLAANFTAIDVRWGGDQDEPLPDEPTAFVFAHFVIDNEGLAAIGGGRGANEWRNDGYVDLYVMTPAGGGAESGLTHAETLATIFRGLRFDGVSFDDCTVSPGERDPENGNYWRTIAHCAFHFHRIG